VQHAGARSTEALQIDYPDLFLLMFSRTQTPAQNKPKPSHFSIFPQMSTSRHKFRAQHDLAQCLCLNPDAVLGCWLIVEIMETLIP